MINPLFTIFESLFARYGELNWWPAKTPYEVIVGAILTQNTAWGNVEKAIANFGGNLTPETVMNVDSDELMELIRPSGFFNQKAAYLKAVTAWFAKYGFDTRRVRGEPFSKVRSELLSTKGVGRETADSILLYAFGFPTFVVDAYTMRLCARYPIDAGKSYDDVKSYFEKHLRSENRQCLTAIHDETELYNNCHALIVINGKEHCRKKPACAGCPLERQCVKCNIL